MPVDRDPNAMILRSFLAAIMKDARNCPRNIDELHEGDASDQYLHHKLQKLSCIPYGSNRRQIHPEELAQIAREAGFEIDAQLISDATCHRISMPGYGYDDVRNVLSGCW